VNEATCKASKSGQVPNGAVCQYNTATPMLYQHTLAVWDSSQNWAVIPVDPVNSPNGGVQVQFSNGDPCGANPRQVTFQVMCKPGYVPATITYTLTTSKTNTCWYTLTTQHDAGCAGSSPGGSPGSGGLSGGSVFLIILVVVIPVYIIAGCIYKRTRQGSSGMEACPNIDFWKELPAYIRDGFRFCWNKIRSCCGKGDGAYTEVK